MELKILSYSSILARFFLNNCGFVQKPSLYTTHATVYILYEIFMLQFVLRIIEYNEGQTM